MRSRTNEEIAECVRTIERIGGQPALNQRLEEVKFKIDSMKKMIVRLERRILEFEMERYTIERIRVSTKCAHCHIIFDTRPYQTPLMDGKVFCSCECLLSEVTKTIEV